MGRKKRQPDPNTNSNSSESSVEDNSSVINGSSCSHVLKAVNFPNVKKGLNTMKNIGVCTLCQKSIESSENKTIELNTVWMCLQCGNQGCGRYSENKHALQHHETPQSNSHAISLCLESGCVWCYECDDEVFIDAHKKLVECVEFIKKQSQKKDKNTISEVIAKKETITKNSVPVKESGLKKEVIPEVTSKPTRNVRGLNNLGNTCFFNSVMQNISQSNCLSSLMNSHAKAGLEVTVEPSTIKFSEKQLTLEPIKLTLLEGGPITKYVEETVRDMQSFTKSGAVNPNILFSHICRKAPQFKGFQQQDSHELLRHLLDGMRLEEVKRIKTAILSHFNVGKGKIENLDEIIKHKIKGYGRSGSQTIMEKVFGGSLISTVVCEECHMSSQVFEPFLDLSLPVSEEKPLRPNLQKKLNLVTSPSMSVNSVKTVSKYQEKKLKRQSKKEAKKKARQEKNSRKSIDNLENKTCSDNLNEDNLQNENEKNPNESFEMSDADVEDNDDTSSVMDNNIQKVNEGDKNQSESSDSFEENEEKCTTAAEFDNLCSKVKGMRIRRKSQSADSLLVEDKENAEESFEVLDSSEANSIEQNTNNDETDMKEMWKARSLTSLAPRYQCSSHECSIQSCLNQFTAAELLTGSNKFRCENCTKLRAEENISDKKKETAYSIANKQLLLFSPPAVLTLHMKRFQQVGFSLKKINRHVSFPLLLDLAPFCSSICLGLPTLKNGQRNVMYTLYGIVEHSGRLSGGHYTAYVKVRENVEDFKNFLNVTPPGQYEIDRLIKEMANKCQLNENVLLPPTEKDLCASNGKWFYVSDSFVKGVSVENVLKAQAYLLFYERVF